MIERNGVDQAWDYIFKIYNKGTLDNPLYVLEPVREKLKSTRLNYAITSFTIEGDLKILLIGGNNGNKDITNEKKAQESLYSSSILFDVKSNRIDEDFELKLPYGKDLSTAITIDNQYVYNFFGRKAVKSNNQIGYWDKENNVPKKRYEYCTEINRWNISNSEKNEFETIQVRFDKDIERCLKPLIIPINSIRSFLIIGGIRGNQVPLSQIWRIDLPPEGEEEKEVERSAFSISNSAEQFNLVYPVQDEEEKKSEEGNGTGDNWNKQLSVPLSFASNNFIWRDNIYSSIGLNASGRSWLLKIDKSKNTFITHWLL